MTSPFRSTRKVSSYQATTLAVALLTIGACTDASGPERAISPGDPAPVTTTLTQVSQNDSPDQLSVAQVVPGFGGYFIDASGRPTVYLTNAGDRATAETALAAFLAERGFTAADLQVRSAEYEYAQLDAWYRVARNTAFSTDGFVLGDVDEANNRIRFGVVNATARSALQSAVVALGVPAGALIVQERAPIKAVVTLRERVRPTIGGLQINFFPTTVTPVTLLCTLGFNAVKDGVNSFITNSHCSNVEGGTTTPTDYYQARRGATATNGFTPIAENFIGVEADDPEWGFEVSTDCPPPFSCRYSDASRAQYAPGVDFTLGRIARIDEITTSLADTTHTISGYFTIKKEQANSVVGESTNKVGRTTGWTVGPATETCVDVLATGTTHIRLCQTIVSGIVAGGDSGSNVFRFRNVKTGQVVLLGVLWGGSTDSENPEFVYSPMSGIERELGELKTF